MPANDINFDRENQFGQEIKAYLNALRKVNQDGPNIVQAIIYMIDGDGSDPTHFAKLVGEGIYPSNKDANESYNELAGVIAKLTQDTSHTKIDAAIKQVCSKHGII